MALKSWVSSANDPQTDFPLQNLPYGVFRHGERTRIGVAIGDRILDLQGGAQQGLLAALPDEISAACSSELLNPLMSLGPAAWTALRHQLIVLLDAKQAGSETLKRVEPLLVPMHEAVM